MSFGKLILFQQACVPVFHPVGAAPAVVAAPTLVSPDTLPGTTVEVVDGTYSSEPSGFSYQWTRAGIDIEGAVLSTYVLQLADLGRQIACRVTALPFGLTTTTSAINGGSEFNFIFLPSLDGSMVPRIGATPVHSRSSGAMYYDSSGLLRWADENRFLRSEDLLHSAWNKVQSSIVGGIADPDGGNTAFGLIPNTTDTTHSLLYSLSGVVAGERHAFQWRIKGDGVRYVHLYGAATHWVAFDTLTGAFGAPSSPDMIFSAVQLSNGWWEVTVSAIPGGNINVGLIMSDSLDGASSTPSTTFNGTTDRLLVWHPAWNRGALAGSGVYLPTTTAAAYGPRLDHRYIDSQWRPVGYVSEGARTNLCARSSEFDNASWIKERGSVTAAAMEAPDGTLAGVFVEDDTTGVHRVYRTTSFVSGTVYTASVFLKPVGRRYVQLHAGAWAGGRAIFDLTLKTYSGSSGTAPTSASVEDCGNGWLRIQATFTATSTGSFATPVTSNNTADTNSESLVVGLNGVAFGIFQMQIEAGLGASSPIPTTTATAVRSADTAFVSGAGFSAVGVATEASVVYAATSYSTSSTRVAFQVDDGGNNNRFAANVVGAVQTFAAGSLSASLYIPPSVIGVARTTSARFKANDFAAFSDGVAGGTDNSGAFPTAVNRLCIGSAGTGAQLEGSVGALLIVNTSLTNAQLQQISGLNFN